MTGNAIDRQVFELDCSSEGTAWAIQKQLMYYTAPALEEIIGVLLEEMEENAAACLIERLEIDLGNIRKVDFGGPEMLEKFRSVCREQLGRAASRLGGENGPGADADMDADWAITRNFLLSGDLPWWVDKSSQPDMDELLWRVAGRRPDRIAAFFDGEVRSMEVVRRIFWQYKAGTLEMLGRMLPDAGLLLRTVLGSMLGSGMRGGDEAGWADRISRTGGDDATGLPGKAGITEFRDRMKSAGLPDQPVEDGRTGGSVSADGTNATGADGSREVGQKGTLRSEAYKSEAHMNAGDSGAGLGVGDREASGVDKGMGAGAGSRPGGATAMHSGKGAGHEGSAKGGLTEMIAAILHRKRVGYGNGYAPWAIGRLVRRVDINWIHSLRAMHVLSEDMFGRLESLLNSRSAGDRMVRKQGEAEIRAILDKLTVLQLALLLHAGRVGVSVEGTGSPGEVSQGMGAPDKMQKDIALAVARRAGAKGTALYEQLMRWPRRELRSLHKKWEQDAAGRADLKKIKARLRDHPYLKDYPLSDLVKGVTGAGAKTGGKGVNKFLGGGRADVLTTNRTITGGGMTDGVTADKRMADPAGTRNASLPRKNPIKKRALDKALDELPEQALRILDQLTGLPEKELRELLSPAPPIATIYNREQKAADRILIDNAGLCLFASYLPGFFKNLGYLNKDGSMDLRFAARAVHLLQYIATGQRKTPEYLLAFPKLLCGLPAGKAIPGNLRLKRSELTEADDLIRAIIDNWRALKNSSADGLRGNFLCRKGIITDKGAQLVLQIERKDYDILLNGISWGYSIIKMPWMAKYIEVQW